MKKYFMKRSAHWIVLFLLTDIVFIFVTWLNRPESLKYISLFLFLFTILICIAGFLIEYISRRKEEQALLRFLETPNDRTAEEFLQRFGNGNAAEMLCDHILGQAALINEKTVELTSYQEYIEAWVHEAKTPLSLSALVLDNHKDEMSPYVYARMHYIQHQLNEDVARILYYARLQAEHSDYKFTRFRLDECAEEILSEYQILINEKKLSVEKNLPPLTVISDRKVVSFMLSQLFSNAVKYAQSSDGKLMLSIYQENDTIHLAIYNNGEGVPAEDAPFIFDKGFTGNHPNRQKATGMGLYLVRKYAEKLCLEVRLDDRIPFDSGFGIELVFTL